MCRTNFEAFILGKFLSDTRCYEIFPRPPFRIPCLFSIYHGEVETVARVYRAIFYSLLFSLSPPFLPVLRRHSFVALHYLPLRNVEDASFHFGVLEKFRPPSILASSFLRPTDFFVTAPRFP